VVGDRFEVDGELWRVLDARRSYICEREQSSATTDSKVAGLLRVAWDRGQAIAEAIEREPGCEVPCSADIKVAQGGKGGNR